MAKNVENETETAGNIGISGAMGFQAAASFGFRV